VFFRNLRDGIRRLFRSTSSGHVFISHATRDDAFVRDLRLALEGLRIPVWADSRNLRGGDALAPEIARAIQQARQVLVVLSPNTINSPWVRREIHQALQVEKRRQAEGYRVIPLLLPGIEPTALEHWFEEEPVAVPVRPSTAGLSEALPKILAALGERLPDDHQSVQGVAAQPVAELLLELHDPHIQTDAGTRRATAMATLVYEPADPTVPRVESRRFPFTAPLGPIEIDELRWYLESYYLWPTGVFKERAERIEAQQRFQTLAKAGNPNAEHMASVTISDRGHCLTALGRLEEAAAAYLDAIARDEKRKDKRSVAVGKAQLANTRMLQQRYADALTLSTEARALFEVLGEPRSVAAIWHQIGITHRQNGNPEQAEYAYRQSLALEVQQHNPAGEASSLLELGNLYDEIGRLEEAVAFSQQAAEQFVALPDLLGEGKARNNLAATRIKLKHYDDARGELYRALECNKPFGHAAEPWKTWSLLHILEQATGNSQAAVDARQQGETTEVEQFLTQASVAADTHPRLKTMLPKLQAILDGDCGPALGDDPALDYRDAAELLLLLEMLGAA
jgi:tetratricopeptide (TPR) repeat protein